ncbi:uncharacterized protein LOC143168758 isoform X2 [Aptenodytes patagonicus]|uniref:uncharacterized protein LOC143168758 isoform X2 n=1 Tax=Aptenodytes patagonicus TaxID=9234 RepID=UPI003F9FB2F5
MRGCLLPAGRPGDGKLQTALCGRLLVCWRQAGSGAISSSAGKERHLQKPPEGGDSASYRWRTAKRPELQKRKGGEKEKEASDLSKSPGSAKSESCAHGGPQWSRHAPSAHGGPHAGAGGCA